MGFGRGARYYSERHGDGTIETPALDYLLPPYWVGRYYGVLTN